MITEAIFLLFSAVLDGLASLLPVGTLDMPDLSGVGGWFGTYAGPLDHWFPVYETAQFLIVLVTVWMPAAITYQVTVWIYKHLPVLGKG